MQRHKLVSHDNFFLMVQVTIMQSFKILPRNAVVIPLAWLLKIVHNFISTSAVILNFGTRVHRFPAELCAKFQDDTVQIGLVITKQAVPINGYDIPPPRSLQTSPAPTPILGQFQAHIWPPEGQK